MRKAFFIWRHASKGYSPAIRYDDLDFGRDEKEYGPKVAVTHDISHLRTGPDYEVAASFAELQKMYPPPVDPVEPKFTLPLQDAAE